MTFSQVTIDLCTGFLENCKLFALTLLMALPLGLIITLGSMSKFKPLKWLKKSNNAPVQKSGHISPLPAKRSADIKSSCTAIIRAKEVSFTNVIISFDIGGTILLTTCIKTTLKNIWVLVIPKT